MRRSRQVIGLLALALLACLVLAARRLTVESIEPTRPYATCEDREAWVEDKQR